jgi:hypothetical protein
LTEEEYEILLGEFDVQVKKEMRFRTLKGERRKRELKKESPNSSLFGSAKKLDFMLMYLKGNMTQMFIGDRFSMSQPKVSQWFSFLLPALESSLDRLGFSPEFGMDYKHKDKGESHLMGDVTERQIPRKTCYDAQQEDFSGKAHMHSEKNFGVCDPSGKILFLSYSFTGSTHDKTIYDHLGIDVGEVPFLLDLGFQGVDETGGTMVPFKKPRGGKLGAVKKQLNKAMSSLRVKVEHAFAGLKRLRMIRDKIRIPSYAKRQLIVKIAAAIHNLRVEMRTTQNCNS